jgi:TonB-linked SusC/RagA family outer membrane protein
MIAGILQVNASVYSQSEVFSIREDGSTMREVFKTIEKQSKFRFFYNDVLTNVDKKVDLVADNMKIDQILDVLLTGTDISYKILENNLIIISPKVLLQQQNVKVKVTDRNTGDPIIGASIVLEGTNKGGITDMQGNLTIEISDTNTILIVSFLGYLTENVDVKGQSSVVVKMSPDVRKLEEVIVIGYGTTKKSDLTGSVSKVKASDLTIGTATSVDNLLQGKASGLHVIASSGEPGSGATIRIRGNNSMMNGGQQNSPLVVVDDVPIGDAGNISMVNPNDIESVDVLKDASATAIYGSQGANGVIMITTKKGKANQNVIEVNAQVSFSALPRPFDIISDPLLYAQLDNEANDNANAIAKLTGSSSTYTEYYNGQNHYGTYYPSLVEIQSGKWKSKTYWPDLIYRTGKTQNYNIAARGGSDKTQYVVSLGYLNSDGIVISNNYKQYTGNFKLNQKVRDNISIGVDSKFETDKLVHSSAAGTEGRSPVFAARDSIGNFMQVGLRDFYNPIAIASEILNTGREYNAITTGFVDWEIIKGLTLHSNVSYKYWGKTTDYYEPRDYGSNGFLFNGYGSQQHYTNTKVINDNFLTYKRTFATKHNVSMMLGSSFQKEINAHQKLEGEGFPSDNLTDQDFPAATTRLINQNLTPDDVYGVRVLSSYFGRLMYNFSDKYLITATIRADGSSVFGAKNKWGYFPSTAVGWNVDKESFFPKTPIITTFKLRAGWGITGTQQTLRPYASADQLGTGSYWNGTAWITGYGPGLFYYQDAQSNVYYQGLANSTLKWEQTAQTNIGTDLTLIHDRIHVTADYYYKKTTNLLYQTQIAPSSGFGYQYQNIASVSNKGFEVALDANIMKSNDLTWDFGANISHNENKVLKLAGNNPAPHTYGTLIDEYRGYANYLIEGQPIGAFYGFRTNGIVQTEAQGKKLGLTGAMAQPGEIAYIGYNHGDSAKVVLGSPEAKVVFGFNTHVTYKGFDLSISSQGTYGNKEVNLKKSSQGRTRFQRWTPDNPNNKYPSLVTGRSISFSDFYLEDGSYLKIQNITLGYSFNVKNTPLIKSLRLFLSCDNVLTFTKFTGYDPEVQNYSVGSETGSNGLNNGGYPRPRVYTTGVHLTF